MPDPLPAIRIFISSPSDVRPERLKAEQIIARLDREFAYHFHVEAVLWEREPLVATPLPGLRKHTRALRHRYRRRDLVVAAGGAAARGQILRRDLGAIAGHRHRVGI
jgi:hypothetical protein